MNGVLVYGASVSVALLSSQLAEQERTADPESFTVGRIIIVGNTVTRDDVIREAVGRTVGIMPGARVKRADLRRAEAALLRLNVFEVNPEKGVRPTVQAVPTEDPDRQDIVVSVEETMTGKLLVFAGFRGHRLVVGFRLEESNYDPRRFPVCWDDILEGKMFRGGGQRVRFQFFLGGGTGR